MTEPASPLGERGIVYFGNDWFAENRTSSHHIATRLARRAPLLYVSSPGLRAPQASGRDLGRMLRKLRASLRAPSEVAPGLWHCTVPQLPFRRIPGVDLAPNQEHVLEFIPNSGGGQLHYNLYVE